MIKGECPRHGDGVNMWLCCTHVAEGKATNVVISKYEHGTAMCFECSDKIDRLSSYNLSLFCEECLREFVNRLKAEGREESVIGGELLDKE